jgi:hypothetical protein
LPTHWTIPDAVWCTRPEVGVATGGRHDD